MISSETFIRHRIGTSLLAVGVILAGMTAYFKLPVAPLPQVEFPTISIQAKLPGASAETMAATVATPLERSLLTVSGITQMTSQNSAGVTQIALQFDLNRNIDGAAQDVQTAITAAAGTLPKNLPNPPTYSKTNPADANLISLALTSDTLPLTELDHYVEDFIAPQLSQMPGVGLVDFHGDARPSVRIRLDPDKVAGLGLSLDDIRIAIGTQTVNAPKGNVSGPDQSVILNATDQLMTVESYNALVVANRNGTQIRLKDLGTVIEAPEDLYTAAWLQDKRTIIIDIHKAIGFNVVETIDGIKARIPQLAAMLPASARLSVASDRGQVIRGSVVDVQFTMLMTVALVVMVIFLFLRNLWATVIPSLTIPLSLIATFGVMYLLGYSLDNLSLMGLTIAVGFVVDDAIVVIENIVRHLDLGKPRLQAAISGVKEVGFTVVSMTVSLVAVFIPVLLMGGVIGRLFREFAVCVTTAVVVSGVVSLTVTPMLCGWLIHHQPEESHGRLFLWSEQMFDAMLEFYRRGLDWVLRHQRTMLGVTLATLVATLALYWAVPKGFFPLVDVGSIRGMARANADISFDAMSDKMQALGHIIKDDPDVDDVYYWIDASRTISQGSVVISLKPFGERKATADQIIARLKRRAAGIDGIVFYMQVIQDIRIGARASGTQYQYTLQDADAAEMDKWSAILLKSLSSLPQVTDVNSDAQASAASVTLTFDRDTASRLGITAQAIDDILYDAFGQRQVATLFTQSNQYHVIEEVAPRFRLSTESLKHLYVRSSLSGQLVPLSLVMRVSEDVSPVTINHQGIFPAVTLSFNLAPGYALGDAVDAINAASQEVGTPETVVATFQGTAQEFQSSLRSQPWLILAAIIVVYIVLGVLYESVIHPLTIISTLPTAGVGALLALMLCGKDLSVIAIIGIIMLIGIVKKNAIMMIDFALTAQRQEGLSAQAAIRQGCLLRFRPIMMTTMAALLGALPLAFGSGAGAELRTPLGISIVGGLVVSQTLTLFTTPVVYLWFDRLGRWIGKSDSALHAAHGQSATERPTLAE